METNHQVAYNAGRIMNLKGRAKVCPYLADHIYAKCWWRGWHDVDREKQVITSG
jgi:hypothetical protein